jgi:MarR family transcriptional regulator, organic hydroperoxide resistance regulator
LALQRAAHLTQSALAARLSGHGLTASEVNVLANLADGHVLAIGELARATGTKPSTLTSLLDRLVSRGYMAREMDLEDRRSFLIRLTDSGQPVAQAARAAMGAVEDAALSRMPADIVAGFHAVVGALTEVS